ncbi:MAG: carboxypeptidase-like regulatory domain-containing protein [Geothrix sp.]|uniref:carboxypeptidase-like regulatory domain-containing protein n=1 Tax=Geothrix sp. TaxID=1962974 RepID=UPI003BAF0245
MWRASSRLRPLLLLVGFSLRAQGLTPLQESEGILVRPILDRKPLGEDLLAIPSQGKVYLPLGEVCRLLAFDITVAPGSASAQGTFLSTRRSFQLNLADGTVHFNGATSFLRPGQVHPVGDDLYVEAGLLGTWFPLSLEVNLKDAVALFAAAEGVRLPILDIWEREGRYAQFKEAGRKEGEGTPKGARQRVPYSFLDVPTLDLGVGWSASAHGGGQKPQVSANLAGDLLWMSSVLFVTHDSARGFRDSRGTLFREDPDGGLMGPLHARRFEVGDLMQSGSLELVGSLPNGQGFSLNNLPLEYRTAFGSRAFRGQLPEGWTVELYQNGTLLGFRRSRPDGRYEFQEVPLRFGMNDFQLLFLGPFGERRKESFRLDIAGDQPPPGSFYYQVMASIPRQQAASATAPETTLTPRGKNVLGSMEYGLSPALSLKAGGARVVLQDGAHQYVVAGLRGVLPYLALDVYGARDRSPLGSSGEAYQGLLRTGFGYNSLSLRRAQYLGGFQTPSLVSTTGTHLLKEETQGDLNASLPSGGRVFSLGGTLWEQSFVDGERRLRSRFQAGLGLQSLSFTAFLGRSRWTTQNQSEMGLTLSARAGGLGLQGEVQSQSQSAGSRGTVWTLNGDYQGSTGMSYRAAIQKASPDSSAILVQAGAARLAGSFGFGVDGTWSRAGGWGVTLRLQLSMQREPRSGQWTTSAQSLASSGSVSAQAFLDENSNGKKDPGERVLEGTRFTVRDGIQSENHSHDPRIAWYAQLGRSQWVPVAVDGASLEDLSLQPSEAATFILPRPGKVIRLDVPVQILGEVNGTTRRRVGAATKDLGGLEVELTSADHKLVRRIRTAYDGFFELRNLPLGSYTLTVTPEECQRLRLVKVPRRTFVVDPTHTVHDGQDLVVESGDQPGPGTPVPPGGTDQAPPRPELPAAGSPDHPARPTDSPNPRPAAGGPP